MTRSGRISTIAHRYALVWLQGAAAALLLVALQLQPPERGDMLLVPLTTQSARNLSTSALPPDARLLARQAATGAIAIRGQRPDVGALLWRHGVLVIAARPRFCGA